MVQIVEIRFLDSIPLRSKTNELTTITFTLHYLICPYIPYMVKIAEIRDETTSLKDQ